VFFAQENISFPADLAAVLEKALQHRGNLGGRRTALRALWEKLAKGRGQVRAGEQHYSFKREEAEAYAAYYLPVNCLKAAIVLEESLLLSEDPIPDSDANWLDLGTGPGTAFWGLAWWCAKRGKKLRFTGWDQSPTFAGIARELAAANPFGAKAEFLTSSEKPLDLIRKIKPTHVSFVNSVAEIYPDLEQRRAEIGKILRSLRELEKADGKARFLLLIEPGSRDSSRELAALKDQLQLEKAAQVLLPCLDARPCGALANPQDWCHEEVGCDFPQWLNELGSSAGMRKEAILFAYALLRAGEIGALANAGGLRMVSQRMERKGQVECRLCTPEGKRMVRVQRSKATTESEILFKTARGDIWTKAEIGEKGDLGSASVFSSKTKSVFG
jgi:ribosomal protein RSM22 (predicted rRNA methylase)